MTSSTLLSDREYCDCDRPSTITSLAMIFTVQKLPVFVAYRSVYVQAFDFMVDLYPFANMKYKRPSRG